MGAAITSVFKYVVLFMVGSVVSSVGWFVGVSFVESMVHTLISNINF